MNRTKSDQNLNEHYGGTDLAASILEGVRAAGKNPESLNIDDLFAVDQFHSRGKKATIELARHAGLEPGIRVLDIGGGLGGSARILAKEYGCLVEVLEIIEEYCRAGALLTARTGLSDRVSFRTGSALDLPYKEAGFDVAWTQHSSMNIAAKERLYREIERVVRPGGRLAIHEIMAGPLGPIHFPVPWARDPSISFLSPPSEVRALLNRMGFTELLWKDETVAALEWFERRLASAPSGSPSVGLHLLLGSDFPDMAQNLVRNLREDRVRVIQAVFKRR